MMRITLIPACFMLILGLGGLAGGQDLPAEILADQYLLEATEALEKGDPQTALRAFGKIKALDIEPPPEFPYFYGKLLVANSTEINDLLKGQSLLKQFVMNVDKTSEHYAPTLRLLTIVESKLAKASQRKAEEAQQRAEQTRRKDLLPSLQQQQRQMVRVEGGTFTMGCTEEDFKKNNCDDDEALAHRVEVGSFAISKYEVTQELWHAVMGKNPSKLQGCAQCPVESVSWDDVQTFLTELNLLTGEQYRLPTEAEWEYAARGGLHSLGYRYAGSNEVESVGWYAGNSKSRMHPVGQKEPNELGLYDMSGNVWEWVQDCWNSGSEGEPGAGKALERGDCRLRVLRGGSWYNFPVYLRSAVRLRYVAGDRNYDLGFRVARTLTS